MKESNDNWDDLFDDNPSMGFGLNKDVKVGKKDSNPIKGNKSNVLSKPEIAKDDYVEDFNKSFHQLEFFKFTKSGRTNPP